MTEQELAFLAFRYCLGRQTYIVRDMVQHIVENWDSLVEYHDIIQSEIQKALETSAAGMDIDEKEWKRILQL